MRGILVGGWPAALALIFVWLALTASMRLPQALKQPASAALVNSALAPSAPVTCLGTLFSLRANTLRTGSLPKLVVALDVTRADRCAGRIGQPVGRLNGFFVLAPDRLAIRTQLRTGLRSRWLELCRWVRADCLDTNAVIRWLPAWAGDT